MPFGSLNLVPIWVGLSDIPPSFCGWRTFFSFPLLLLMKYSALLTSVCTTKFRHLSAWLLFDHQKILLQLPNCLFSVSISVIHFHAVLFYIVKSFGWSLIAFLQRNSGWQLVNPNNHTIVLFMGTPDPNVHWLYRSLLEKK